MKRTPTNSTFLGLLAALLYFVGIAQAATIVIDQPVTANELERQIRDAPKDEPLTVAIRTNLTFRENVNPKRGDIEIESDGCEIRFVERAHDGFRFVGDYKDITIRGIVFRAGTKALTVQSNAGKAARVEIEDCVFDGFQRGGDEYGAFLHGVKGITMRGCLATNTGQRNDERDHGLLYVTGLSDDLLVEDSGAINCRDFISARCKKTTVRNSFVIEAYNGIDNFGGTGREDQGRVGVTTAIGGFYAATDRSAWRVGKVKTADVRRLRGHCISGIAYSAVCWSESQDDDVPTEQNAQRMNWHDTEQENYVSMIREDSQHIIDDVPGMSRATVPLIELDADEWAIRWGSEGFTAADVLNRAGIGDAPIEPPPTDLVERVERLEKIVAQQQRVIEHHRLTDGNQ